MLVTIGNLMAAPAASEKPVPLNVDTDTTIQEDFLGVNAVYHGFAFMREQTDRGMDDDDREREFGRVQRVGLKIARTWYRPNYACPVSIWDAPDWNSPRMKALYSWLQAMKDRNVDIALQLGWWFTRDTYYGREFPDPETDPARFAAWVSESLHQIIEVRRFTNVKYGILFTEPTEYEAGIVPKGYTQWSYYVKMVKAIDARLKADGRRGWLKLVGPNNSSQAADLINAVGELNDQIDIYSGHHYNKRDYAAWLDFSLKMKRTVAPTGKPCWLDEWGDSNEPYRQSGDYGTYVAQAVAAGMNAGLQNLMSWILFDQQYVGVGAEVGNDRDGRDSFHHGVHRWGFAKWPHDSISSPVEPYPAWYAFGLMCKYLGGGGGTKVYQTSGDGGFCLTAVKQPSGDWSFLVVNTNVSAAKFQLSVSHPLNRILYRYLYDPARIVPTETADLLESDRRFPNVSTSFSDTLPARGVAIYSTLGTTDKITPMVEDALVPPPPGSVKFTGCLGDAMAACKDSRLLNQNVVELVNPFAKRDENQTWRGEFWGKWFTSAALAYRYETDPKLRAIMDEAVENLLATQSPDGSITTYEPTAEFSNWDTWGRKYTLLGLLAYHELSGDAKVLDAACRHADRIISYFGPSKANIATNGWWSGMAAGSILEPMVLLFRRTGNTRYLEFAKYIVRSWESPGGPDLLRKALNRVAVFRMFPGPDPTMKGYMSGGSSKAYEMMSCYEGLLELYRVTGEPEYLDAAQSVFANIRDTETTIIGSGSSWERWANGHARQAEVVPDWMETCVTVTWLKFAGQLLRLTGDSLYADEIERTTYNSLLGAQKSDGRWWCHFSPLEGQREPSSEQCGMHLSCCVANGPRGLMLLPTMAVMSGRAGPVVNFYEAGNTTLPLRAGKSVRLDIGSDYPRSGEVQIVVQPESAEDFTLISSTCPSTL